MKITWIQDLEVFTSGGGAQLTDRTHIIEGLRRGHSVDLLTPQSGLTTPDKDAFVISNASVFRFELFENLLTTNKPLIWFLHDYWPICKYRLFYPMQDTCKSCYLKERWLPVLLKAKLIIWLSPLHRESWLWLYPELKDIPYHLSPSPVEPHKFYPIDGIKREGIIAVESLHPFKGRANVLDWVINHPDKTVTFVGGNAYPNELLPPNARQLDFVPYGAMNEQYNQHEHLLHLPQSPSPFDRTTVEAYLAGCKIIGNELIGALSYDWFKSREEVAEHCRESPKEFWKKIKEVL